MTCFSFRENKLRKTPEQWLQLPWERDAKEDKDDITEEDAAELQALIRSVNERTRGG